MKSQRLETLASNKRDGLKSNSAPIAQRLETQASNSAPIAQRLETLASNKDL